MTNVDRYCDTSSCIKNADKVVEYSGGETRNYCVSCIRTLHQEYAVDLEVIGDL